MYTVIVQSGFEPTTTTHAADNRANFYSYGPFRSFGAASRWAVNHLSHIADNYWHIAQHITILEQK